MVGDRSQFLFGNILRGDHYRRQYLDTIKHKNMHLNNLPYIWPIVIWDMARCGFYRSCQLFFRKWWWKLWKTVNGACDCLAFNLTALSKPWTYLISSNLEAKTVTGCIFTCRCQSIFLHMPRLWNTLNDPSNQAISKTLLIVQ